MNKAKIMLSALVGIVGVSGAFAFKAQKLGRTIYEAPSQGTKANLTISNYTLTTVSGADEIQGYYTVVFDKTVNTASTAYHLD